MQDSNTLLRSSLCVSLPPPPPLSLSHTHTHTHLQVIAMAPSHESWQRNRPSHHGGAQRSYSQPPTPHYGRTSPPYCEYCVIAKRSSHTANTGSATSTSKQHKKLPMLAQPTHTNLGMPVLGMDLLDDIDSTENKGGGERLLYHVNSL